MSLSRAEMRRRIRDNRMKWAKRTFWFVATVAAAGLLGAWLWEWTGTPAYLE
ncbi:hypothetical protein [Paenibacillus antri]|uniref:hypothetical protein n=1 Tax=Paenibacillus antri TaxID=2582848 RepID=UPI0013052901|nr:hypothetical protein [Paenibacillus antri]